MLATLIKRLLPCGNKCFTLPYLRRISKETNLHFSLHRITRNSPSPPVFTSSKTGEISKDGPQRNCLSISQVTLSSANLSIKTIIVSRSSVGLLTGRVSGGWSTGPLTHALQVVPRWSHQLVPHKITCTGMSATCNVSGVLYEPCLRILHQMLQGLAPFETEKKKLLIEI